MGGLLLAILLAAGGDAADAGVLPLPPAATRGEPAQTPPQRGDATASNLRRGDAAFAARDFRAALFAFQDALRIAPDNLEALVKAGQSYARLGHDDEAIAQWTRALALDPQNATARDGLAAARERQAALAVDDAAARYTRAVGLIRARKFAEGAAELDRALAQKPHFAVALVARGSARIGQGRFEDALADYAAAQKEDPRLASPLLGLAEAYRGLGQKEKAAQLYRQFAQSDAPDAQPALKDYALQSAQALAPP